MDPASPQLKTGSMVCFHGVHNIYDMSIECGPDCVSWALDMAEHSATHSQGFQSMQSDLVTAEPPVPSKTVSGTWLPLHRCTAMYCQDRTCPR